MPLWTLELPGWHPVSDNLLTGCHWATRRRRKRHDAGVLAAALLAYGVTPAAGKRRVSLTVVWGPGQRSLDKFNLFKSLLDALVACGALRNDSSRWLEADPPHYARGERLTTFLTIQEIP